MNSSHPVSAVTPSYTDDEEPPSSACHVDVDLIIDENVAMPLAEPQIQAAIHLAAQDHGFSVGSIGVRVTDDRVIRGLNDKHLGHDYETDVISFGYHAEPPHLEGELVVSVDTARQRAAEIGWPIEHELLLYIVHGVLHICGMDDHQPDDRAAMRRAEARVFTQLGIDEISRCGADLQREDRQRGDSQ